VQKGLRRDLMRIASVFATQISPALDPEHPNLPVARANFESTERKRSLERHYVSYNKVDR